MWLPPAQMAAIKKVPLPSVEVFDFGSRDFYLREPTQVHCWKVTEWIHSNAALFFFSFFFLGEVTWGFSIFCYVILRHRSILLTPAASIWQLEILLRWRFYINTHDFIKIQIKRRLGTLFRCRSCWKFVPNQRREKIPNYEYEFWLPSFINH